MATGYSDLDGFGILQGHLDNIVRMILHSDSEDADEDLDEDDPLLDSDTDEDLDEDDDSSLLDSDTDEDLNLDEDDPLLDTTEVGDVPVGGYDCQFVEELPDSLRCLICTNAARDPQQLDCCGKIFCQSCLSQLKRSRNKGCPNCRSKTWKSFSDKKSDRDLKSLTVKCSNLDISGCSWLGELRELESHIATCSNDLQPCKYTTSIGCKVQILKKDLPSHEEQCTADHLKLAMEKIESLSKQLQPLLALPDRLRALEATKAHVNLPPVTFKICHFLERSYPTWESPPFYSHRNGYKLYLKLTRSSLSLSVDVCLMRGEHDNHLVWPFRGVVRFQMLNQEADVGHRQGSARFMERRTSSKNQRVPETMEKSEVGWGVGQFFFFGHTMECEQYLLNGCLYIRVKEVDIADINKPWLLT